MFDMTNYQISLHDFVTIKLGETTINAKTTIQNVL